jgi:hypothetical protein
MHSLPASRLARALARTFPGNGILNLGWRSNQRSLGNISRFCAFFFDLKQLHAQSLQQLLGKPLQEITFVADEFSPKPLG